MKPLPSLPRLGALVLAALVGATYARAAEPLLVFAGAASKPPTEEAAALYERKTGVKVELVFGGSGYVLSQMKLARQGDVYFPGSSYYTVTVWLDNAADDLYRNHLSYIKDLAPGMGRSLKLVYGVRS